MPEPRLSVLMTLYNKGPYVLEALRSVLDGEFRDLEVLVVDDASTDDGAARVRALPDARIRLLTSDENTGRAAAANRGLNAATGEFVAVLDADDIAAPDRFEKQIRFLDQHPEVGIVGSAARVFGTRDRIVRWPRSDQEARAVMLFEDPMLYGTCMYRRRVATEHRVQYRDDWRRPGMDYFFLLAMAAHTRMANLDEPLTSYRLGEQNFRHGRDAVEVRTPIVEEALRWFGVEASSEEALLMLMLGQHGPEPNTAEEIKSLWRWVQKLRQMNRQRGLFPRELFEQRLMKDWRRWFYILADHSRSRALEHLRCEGGVPIGRIYYLARTMVPRRARK